MLERLHKGTPWLGSLINTEKPANCGLYFSSKQGFSLQLNQVIILWTYLTKWWGLSHKVVSLNKPCKTHSSSVSSLAFLIVRNNVRLHQNYAIYKVGQITSGQCMINTSIDELPVQNSAQRLITTFMSCNDTSNTILCSGDSSHIKQRTEHACLCGLAFWKSHVISKNIFS